MRAFWAGLLPSPGSLMSSIRKALFHSSVSQYGVKLIGLVTTMIVARLLTLEQLGVFAIASGIVMMLSEFKLMGAADYLIREVELSEGKIRRALGLTIIISWGLGIAVAVSGPWVAMFYEMPSLETLFYILSLSFFLSPFISIAMALANREFNFRIVLHVNFVGAIVSLVTTVVLIKLGFGYYALAWAIMARVVTEMIMVMISLSSSVYWRPSFRNVREIAIFGVFNSTANVVKRGIKTVPDMVIGKMGTTTQVGLFSRGLGFVDFLASTLFMGVSPVVLPFLSETRRQGGDVLRAYTRACLMLGALVWPVLTVAAIASLPTIRIFFGPQWDAAAPVASFMAIWMILRTTHNLSNNLLVATGREKLTLVKELLLLLLAVAFVILAFPYGLNAVASSFVLLGIAEIVMVSWILKYFLGLNVARFYRELTPNLFISVLCGLATWAISFFVPFSSEDAWKPVGVIALCLPPVWIGSVFLVKHPLADELMGIVRRVVTGRR